MTLRRTRSGGHPSDDGEHHRLVVLQSFRQPRSSSNPYLSQLVASLPGDVDVRIFSWPAALRGRYDVLHVQWPELLVRGRNRPRTLMRKILFSLLLCALALRRVPVVRTVHNLQPHEPGRRVERWLLGRLDHLTTIWVTLSEHTPLPASYRPVTILHGHYRDWFAKFDPGVPVSGRMLYFGLVRRYKGVEQLVEAFQGLQDDDLTLRIVGQPSPPELGQAIDASIGRDSRVSAQWSYLPDEELAREIGESNLVVLPYLEILNSGSVLLALSLDRTVLVPRAPTTVALQQEVGPTWVVLFEPPLTSEDLRAALAVAHTRTATARPDLSQRDWSELGQQFSAVYRRAARDRAGRRRYSV